MILRIFISIIFFTSLVMYTNAQNTSENNSGISSNLRELNLSIFTGFSLLGPKDDIESNMLFSGLGDTSNFGGSSSSHPVTYKSPIFDIEASYNLSQKSGISLNFGLINSIRTHGYETIGVGNFLFLKSEIWSFSLNYAYRSKNNKQNIFIGPSYFIYSVKDVSHGTNSPNNISGKLGAYVGYSLKVLMEKKWFIALKTNYRWAPKSETGSFIAEHRTWDSLTGNSTTHTSEFPSVKVKLASLNIGLCVGIRIDK